MSCRVASSRSIDVSPTRMIGDPNGTTQPTQVINGVFVSASWGVMISGLVSERAGDMACANEQRLVRPGQPFSLPMDLAEGNLDSRIIR